MENTEDPSREESIRLVRRIWEEQVLLANDNPTSYNAGSRDVAFKIGVELFGQDFSRGVK
jgi:hypothetical protein